MSMEITRSMPIAGLDPINRTRRRGTPVGIRVVEQEVTTFGSLQRQAQLNNMGPDAVHRLPLDYNNPDAYQIIGYLNNIAEQYAQMPEIREFTVSLIKSQNNNDIDMQVAQVVNFVKDHMIFTRDPVFSEYVIAPDRLISQIIDSGTAYGDCDDHVLLLNTMLGSVGIPARVVGVKLYESERFDHVISQVWIRGEWRDIDPCAKTMKQPRYWEKLV